MTYEVKFNGTWSADDIKEGVVFPSSAHFTELIGATHASNAQFWSLGNKASLGVENVAEIGSNAQLKSELFAAKNAGTTGELIEFDSLFGLPNSSSLEIEVEADKPFISLISMIAPSPDWFVGVSGVSLLEDGVWLQSLRIELKPYDAGTEDGDQFSLSNPPSSNSEVITRLFGTDSPFLGRPTIGTLTFTLIDIPIPPPPPKPNDEKFVIGAIINQLLSDEG